MSGKYSHILTPFLIILGIFGFVFAFFYLRNILLLFFFALIISSALSPVVKLGQRWKVPAPITILLLYTLLFSSVSLLFSLVIPPLVQQTAQLAQSAGQELGISQLQFNGWASLDLDMWARSYDQYRGFFNQITGSVQTMLQILLSTFSALFVFFTLLVLTFHILMSMDHVALSYAWLMPGSKAEKKKKSLEILHSIQVQLGSWVRGQIALMFIVGLMTYVGLVLLGIPYALPLALLAGFLEIVPNLGPTIATVPAVLVAFLLVNPWMGLFTLLFFILVQQLENNVIVPLIMKEAVDVHPLTTILLMLIGFQALGVVGAILVIPFYISIRTVCRSLWPDIGPFMNLSGDKV